MQLIAFLTVSFFLLPSMQFLETLLAWAPEVFTKGDYHGTLSFPIVMQIFDSLFLMVDVLLVSVERVQVEHVCSLIATTCCYRGHLNLDRMITLSSLQNINSRQQLFLMVESYVGQALLCSGAP